MLRSAINSSGGKTIYATDGVRTLPGQLLAQQVKPPDAPARLARSEVASDHPRPPIVTRKTTPHHFDERMLA